MRRFIGSSFFRPPSVSSALLSINVTNVRRQQQICHAHVSDKYKSSVRKLSISVAGGERTTNASENFHSAISLKESVDAAPFLSCLPKISTSVRGVFNSRQCTPFAIDNTTLSTSFMAAVYHLSVGVVGLGLLLVVSSYQLYCYVLWPLQRGVRRELKHPRTASFSPSAGPVTM